jgi:hypothetical protein
MTRQQREEFWRRFHAEIERFRASGVNCDVAINPFGVRRWNVKFVKRRAGYKVASVTLAILEHAPSREEFLLAVTPTYTVEEVVWGGEPFLILSSSILYPTRFCCMLTMDPSRSCR